MEKLLGKKEFESDSRSVGVFDIPWSGTRCYKCFYRPSQVYMQHFNDLNMRKLGLKLFEWIPGGSSSYWCVPCVARTGELGSTQDYVRSLLEPLSKWPSTDELEKITNDDIKIKKRDDEEYKCVCLKHKRLCHSAIQDEIKKKESELKMFMYPWCSMFDLIHFNVEIRQKFNDFEQICNSFGQNLDQKEAFGKWLVWAGDYEVNNRKIDCYAHTKYERESEKLKVFKMIVLMAFYKTRRTRCGHDLPKPYENCWCDFSEPYWKVLSDTILDEHSPTKLYKLFGNHEPSV